MCGSTEVHCSDLRGWWVKRVKSLRVILLKYYACQSQDEFGLCDKTVFVTSIQTSATATATQRPIATPSPIIAGMVSNCDDFELIRDGKTCSSIAAERGVALSDFMRFNPGLPNGCTSGFWLGWYVCVSIVGHSLGPPYNATIPASPPSSVVTGYGGYRLWGCVSAVPAPILPG